MSGLAWRVGVCLVMVSQTGSRLCVSADRVRELSEREKNRSCKPVPARGCMEKVRAGTAREAGLGHAGGRAMHGAIAEDAKAEAGIQRQTMI